MSWFGKKKQQIETQKALEEQLSVELKIHGKAADKTIAKSKKVTEEFNQLIKENGFTLKIHVAAGGKRT